MNDQLHEITNDLTQIPRGSPTRIWTALLLTALACGSAAAQQFSPWSTPVNLGPSINTTFSELHPAISADGLSLFFPRIAPAVSAEVTCGWLGAPIETLIGKRHKISGRA